MGVWLFGWAIQATRHYDFFYKEEKEFSGREDRIPAEETLAQ